MPIFEGHSYNPNSKGLYEIHLTSRDGNFSTHFVRAKESELRQLAKEFMDSPQTFQGKYCIKVRNKEAEKAKREAKRGAKRARMEEARKRIKDAKKRFNTALAHHEAESSHSNPYQQQQPNPSGKDSRNKSPEPQQPPL